MISLWAPVVAWMAAMFYGSLMPTVPSQVADNFSDTALHGGGYFLLALITLRAVARGRWAGVTRSALLITWVIAMIHGSAVEWLQMYVPTRMAEWRDLGNDGLGAGLALGLVGAWGIMRSTSRAKPDG